MLGGRQIDPGSESRSGPENRTVGTDSVDLIDGSFIQGISIGWKPEFAPGLRILVGVFRKMGLDMALFF